MGKTLTERTKTSSEVQPEVEREPGTENERVHEELRATEGLEAQEAKLRPPGGKKPAPPRPRRAHPALPEKSRTANAKNANAKVAERLDKGSGGLGMISDAVDADAKIYGAKVAAREEAIKKNNKRTFFQKLARKGKQRVPPPPPKRDHAGARAQLAHARMSLESQAAQLREATTKASPKVLPVAAGTVDNTASKMLGKVNLPIIDNTRDLAVGLREGDQAMLARVLARGGTLHYETLAIRNKIATNAEAVVFQADYLGMAPVAYKLAKSSQLYDDSGDAQANMLEEHKTMRQAGGGKNTLRAGGRTTSDNRVGFIMELAKKGDLAGVGEATQSLPLAERLEVWKHLMRGGFRGLEKLHGAGFVHGDVKNQNFLLGDDHEAKLMDFGTTKREGESKWSGTSEYMAPEVGKGGVATKAADVWSMGESLLLGLLNMNSTTISQDGKKADSSFKQEVVREQHLRDGKWLTKLEGRVKGMPGADVFMDFIKKTMAMDPKDRLSASAALKHDFLALKTGERNKGKEKLAEHLARQG